MALLVEYPCEARPARITRKFAGSASSNPHMGVDLYAPRHSRVFSGTEGVVKKIVTTGDKHNIGAYVTVLNVSAGQKTRVTYANLQNIQVVLNQPVTVGTLLGQSAGGSVKLIIQTLPTGLSGFSLPAISNPKKHLRLSNLRLRPIDNRLRLRTAPSTDAPVAGFVNQWDFLQTPENTYKVLTTVGVQDKWLKVISPFDGVTVLYTAAWFMKVVSLNDPREGIPNVPIAGVNLDLDHPLGTPTAAPLAQLGWVRLLYNVSYNPSNGTFGNTDLNATYNRYLPILQRYATNGNKVILVLGHQTYGEGQGYNWEMMDSGQWAMLIAQFANFCGQIAQRFAGSGLVYAYQIWNEQDSPVGSWSAVAVPPVDYAMLFAQAYRAIRAVDSKVNIITGGHATGTNLGVKYARATLAAMPSDVLPDGIGVHPYLTGPAGSPFSIFGTINESIERWSGVLPNLPIWITEWGILDKQGQDQYVNDATSFAQGFIDICLGLYPAMVVCAVWYAWADTMHNGYGLVRSNNSPREPLYTTYLTAP